MRLGFLKKVFPSLSEIKKYRYSFVLAAISGLIMRLAYPKPDLWPIAWVGLVPFVLVLYGKSSKVAFHLGWLFGFCFYYSNIFWLNTLTAYNTFIPIGIILLGLYMGLYGAIFGLLFNLFTRSAHSFGSPSKNILQGSSFLIGAALWVALEYLRSITEFAFPWTLLASSQYKVNPLIQIGDLTGPYGVSFLIILTNIIIAEIVYSRLNRVKIHLITPITILIVLIAGSLFYGIACCPKSVPGGQELKVGIVQPSVPQDIKLASYLHPDTEVQTELQGDLLDQLVMMLLRFKAEDVDLIVAPETAITELGFGQDEELHVLLGELSRQVGAFLLIGAGNVVAQASLLEELPHTVAEAIELQRQDYKVYNSAWLVHKDKGLLPVPYNKIQLVPFGEYIPFFANLPILGDVIINIGNFDRGKNYTIFECKGIRFGAVICFESSFPWLLRRFVRQGAEFLVVITNDAWYGQSAGAYQHTSLSVFRAIETRRYIVRAANHGISCIIAPDGKIMKKLDLEKEDILTGVIRASRYNRVYTKYGDLFSWLCLAVIIASGILTIRQRA